MLKLFIIAFSLWAATGPLLPKSLDFEDKSLQKELRKVSELVNDEWKDMTITATLPNSNSLQGKFLMLSGSNNNEQKRYAYVGRVNSCRQGGCSNPAEKLSVETSEYFDYLIIFDARPSVQLIKVYNYQATHGQEVSTKGWLKQFVGYDGSRTLTVGKGIDAISGATVSVYEITNDIQEKTRLLKKIVDGKE